MMVKNQYDGKIDLLKLIFLFHLPEIIYRVNGLLCRWFLEGETEILVLIHQF